LTFLSGRSKVTRPILPSSSSIRNALAMLSPSSDQDV
jgi:hypothetical protein